ncbi:MAG TPA: hypothetical protein DHU96_00230 [Actinobacteria bacterium]|nr:hypothetical protein [Actinomycetota bacterium]
MGRRLAQPRAGWPRCAAPGRHEGAISARTAATAGIRLESALLNLGSSRITISRYRSAQSLRISHICRTSHGLLIRRLIRSSPSLAGSMESAAACNARRRMSSKS